MSIAATTLLSAVALNRKRFFELVASIERECDCDIDVDALVHLLDWDFPAREEMTPVEARRILMTVGTPRNKEPA